MKTLFTTIFLLISFLTFSQSTSQIVDTTKKWNTVYYGVGSWNIVHCGGTRTNKIAGEVIFNDGTFFNVYESQDSLQQDWDQVGYLREDTISKKVYFSEWDPEEIGLIYDFDLKVGDSVKIDNYYVGFEDVLLICDSVNSFIISGILRNQFYFSTPDMSGISDIWIEGIGSKYGLLYSGIGGAGFAGGGTDLLCCSKSDTIIYMDTLYNSCFIQEFYPKIVSEYYDTAYLNEYYEFQLQLSGTNNVDSFALIGDVIPEDFEFNDTTGLLTGIPSSTGSYPCIITLRNYDIGFLTDMLYSEIIVVLPTTIEDVPKQPEIKIHPIPFSSCFSISYDGNLKDSYYLEIFNCEGKMIDKKTITETTYKVDCSNYKNGIYLLKITDLNQRILKIEKIIKK
ncbi:MAG: T9SS type A sorting domain-containing protein [Bacteroidales bacterium]